MAGRKGEGARFPTSHLSICQEEEEEEEARVPGTKTTKNLRSRTSQRKTETAAVAAKAMMEEEKGAKAEGGIKECRGAGTASHGRAHIL